MSVDLCELTGRDKEHLIQKCLPIQDIKGELKFPLLASEKIDGVFCIAKYDMYERNSVTIYSRTGKEYYSLEHLKSSLRLLMEDTDIYFIIFEAFKRGVKESVISGWCRDTKNQHTELSAYVHDALTYDDFLEYTETPYFMRYDELCSQYDKHKDKLNNIELAKQATMRDISYIIDLANIVYSYAGEGLVLRDPSAAYQAGKRNETMIKVKKILSYDLTVVDVEEGKGKYTNHVGKLICKWQDNKTIKVGTGLSDAERKTWWSYRNSIIGKIVQVDAMAISTKGILREPRYKGIRYDKTEGDY